MQRRDFLKGGAAVAGAALLSSTVGRQSFAAQGRSITKSLKYGVIAGKDADGNDLDVEARLRVAKEAGFDSVEPNTIFEPDAVEAFGKAAGKVGIKVDAVVCSTHWGDPLSDPDPAVYNKTLEGMRVSMRNAKELGGDMVLLVPAVVNPEVRYAEAYRRSVERVKWLSDEAAKMDIVIGIENVWNKFLLSPIEARDYIHDIGSEYVQFWFDVGNVVLFGYPQDWILTLGPLIARVDVKDFDAGSKSFVPLQEGSVDWPEVMRAFDEIGYEGVFAAEVKGGDKAYLTDVVSGRMDKIIAAA